MSSTLSRLREWLWSPDSSNRVHTDNAVESHHKRQQALVLDQKALSALPVSCFPDESRGNCTWQTLFSAPSTNTDSLTVGIATCKPNGGFLAMHRHTHAEIYHVISGEGVVEIDEKEHLVRVGDVVFIPGNAEHRVRNLNASQDFKWLYCFAADGFENITYQFKSDEGA